MWQNFWWVSAPVTSTSGHSHFGETISNIYTYTMRFNIIHVEMWIFREEKLSEMHQIVHNLSSYVSSYVSWWFSWNCKTVLTGPLTPNIDLILTNSARVLRKPDVYWGDYLEYRMRISVDGTWMDSTGTNIYCGGACTFWVRFSPSLFTDTFLKSF